MSYNDSFGKIKNISLCAFPFYQISLLGRGASKLRSRNTESSYLRKGKLQVCNLPWSFFYRQYVMILLKRLKLCLISTNFSSVEHTKAYGIEETELIY